MVQMGEGGTKDVFRTDKGNYECRSADNFAGKYYRKFFSKFSNHDHHDDLLCGRRCRQNSRK